MAEVTGAQADPAADAVPVTSSDAGARPDSAAAEKKKSAASRVIEEIVVTAQKREENLRDVPISVSAFSGEKLEALGVVNAEDLPQITPGLQVDNLVGYNIIFLRGVGSDIFLPSADSSVATYLDGIYTPFAHSLAQEFGKLERIEVLKGPQGTLYGRNSTGGAINTVTAKPGREFSGNVAIEGGSFNARKLKLYVTGPISETVQVGLSAFNSYSDSYYERPDDSQYPDFLPDKTHGGQLKVNWDITDDLALTLTGLMTRTSGSTQQILSSLEVRPAFTLLVPERNKAWEADPDLEPYGRSENDMVYGELRWNSPYFFDTKLLASHQDIVTDFNVDFDGDKTPLVGFNPKNQGALYTTAELQILSNDSSWMSERLNWIAGYYFYRQRNAGFRDIELGVAETLTDPLLQVPTTGINELISGLNAGLVNLGLNGLQIPVGVPTEVKPYFNGLVEADADAFFVHATYHFTDQWALTLGARYQSETKRLVQSELGLVTGTSLSPALVDWVALAPVLNYPLAKDTSNFSPKATIDYRMPDDTLIFVTAQKGFKSGTFQIANITTPPEYVLPEEIVSYELGVKGRLFDDSLQYTFGVFQNTIENVQVAIISLLNGGAISFENAQKTRIRGIDGDLLLQPLPSTLPGLVFTASAAYLDGKYLSYPDGDGFNALGILQHNYDHSGNKTVRTPEYSYNVGASYTHETSRGVIEVGGSYYYNDGYFFDPQNVAVQPSYSVVNARLSYLHEPWGLRCTLFGSNLGNSEYFLSRFPVDFNISGLYAPSRAVGLRLDYSF